MKPYLLQDPIDAITFDCDGTLSAIEGIDELARLNQVGPQVQQLTEEAMGKTGLNAKLYQQRLDLVRPTKAQVQSLGESYFVHKTPDILDVIQLLQSLNKSIYIISAGIYPAVVDFGKRLNIAKENVFAVDISFDHNENFQDFDHASPLITDAGKKIIGMKLKEKHPRFIHVGDGLNDYSIYELVERFVGFGGFFYRENIKKLCEFYITEQSMSALLPLCLTAKEVEKLTPSQLTLYQKGLAALNL